MVLLHKSLQPRATWEFEAEIVILFHSTTINVNYQPVIHVGTVRQCAKILSMSQEILRTGDRGVVRFRFMFRPEYIQPGTRIIFREGRTKGIGMIKRFPPFCFPPPSGSQPKQMDRRRQKKHSHTKTQKHPCSVAEDG